MTRKLLRSFVAIVLAELIALAPVTPALGQNQSQAPGAPSNQAPGAPPATPAQPQSQPAAQTQPVPVTPFQFPRGRDYTQPRRAFPHVLGPYSATHVDEPQLTNSPRIEQLIHDGKLELSLEDAVELALENNLDIMVQRYYPWIAESDILRTLGGGQNRGTSNTTTPGVFANLPAISFDPALTSALSVDSRAFPVNNPLTAGTGVSQTTAASLFTHTEIGNFQYAQAFHTGTSFALSLNTTRSTTTSPAVHFNPAVQTTGTLAFAQPLLNGFGLAVNERFLNVARLTKNASDEAFVQSILTDITAVEDDYWELVFARGNVSVEQQAVALAQRLYDNNKRQVEVGTLAPIEIVRAQAQVATAQQALIQAQTAQLQQQTLLMSVISKNPTAPALLNVEIIPSDSAQIAPPVENLPLVDAVNEALAKRPDVAQAKITLSADDINIQATRNALLPALTLSAFATGAGLGGNTKNPTPPPALLFGGFGDAASDVFRGAFPEFEAQLALNLPLRNRTAQADNARAQLVERQDQTRLQQTINNVMVDVQNALILLQQDRATVQAAQQTRELQQQTLDAEQKKLDLGASTIFLVVTDQQALAAAAAAEVRAEVNLEEALVNFQRAMGRTLEVHRITVANAKSGVVPRDMNIPGTRVTGELIDPKKLN